MKKIALILAFSMITSIFTIRGKALEITGTSTSMILMENSTGQVLYQENSSEKLPIASLTKIMSMLLWAEDISDGKYSLNDMVTTSPHANSMDGSVIWLNVGEEMSVETLLKSVTIASANDACVAMAEKSAGSEEEFVKRMNAKAKALGMKNTQYKNSTGYDEEGHYSTAYDIALVSRELLKHNIYNEYMLTWLEYIRGGETQLLNTNKLVRSYEGIIGLKTGTTDKAKNCFSGAAERGDMKLITVVLGAETTDERFSVAADLLDYGFSSFEIFSPTIDTTQLNPIKVNGGVNSLVNVMVENFNTGVIPKGKSQLIQYDYSYLELLQAPVLQGQQVGTVKATLDGVEVYSSRIITENKVEELTFFRGMLMLFTSLFNV